MAELLSTITDGLQINHYKDWLLFEQRLRELVASGAAEEVPPSRVIWVKGEEWYRDTQANEYYVYVKPDSPILPIWERINPLE